MYNITVDNGKPYVLAAKDRGELKGILKDLKFQYDRGNYPYFDVNVWFIDDLGHELSLSDKEIRALIEG